MKALITGGAGFIGSHLASKLVDMGEDVRILDNFSAGKRENISGLPVEIVAGDIRDTDTVNAAVSGVDTVFHLAALCSVVQSMEDPVKAHEVNSLGTLKVLDACRHHDVGRFVFSSSSAVYGNAETLPNHEHLPTVPLSPYGLNKLMGEHYCRIYWQAYGLETVALRYFNVFGPRQDPNSDYAAVIPKFIHKILAGEKPVIYGDGLQTRDFTAVDNVVQANILAARTQQASSQAMNIACGDSWNLIELLDCITQILEVDITPEFQEGRQGEVRHSQACIARAQTLIGFSPDIGFETGLRKTIQSYEQSLNSPRSLDNAVYCPGSSDEKVVSPAPEAKVVNARR